MFIFKFYFIFYVVFFVFLSFQIASVKSEKPAFIATFPSTVLANSEAKLCISFANLNSEVTFTVSDNEPACFSQVEKTVPVGVALTCVDLLISNSNLTQTTLKEISVKGSSRDGLYSFRDTKKYTYKEKSHFSLIETDKPVYKPGDKVKVRVLTVDFNLRPLKAVVFEKIIVLDSSGSRVNQWLDVKSSHGLVDFEMSLSEEPNMGQWTIEVYENSTSSGMIKVNFEVRKYVLPKFEVYLEHPNTIVATDEFVRVSVCAKYSYGKQVKGQFELAAFTKRYFYGSFNEQVNLVVRKSAPSGQGCVELRVRLNETGISRNSYLNRIYLNASVTEASTQISASATSSASVSFRDFDAELVEPSYYKPGIPVYYRVQMKSVDGSGLANERFLIRLEKDERVFYEAEEFTDSSGHVSFRVDPGEQCNKECGLSRLSEKPEPFKIKLVRVGKQQKRKSEADAEWNGGGGYGVNSNANVRSFQIEPWYTEKNSYLQIEKPEGGGGGAAAGLDCVGSLRFKVLVRTFERKLEDGTNIHFQVQARSGVYVSGVFSTQTNQTSNTGPKGRASDDEDSRTVVKMGPVGYRELAPRSASFKQSLNEKCRQTQVSVSTTTTTTSVKSAKKSVKSDDESEIVAEVVEPDDDDEASHGIDPDEANEMSKFMERWFYDERTDQCTRVEVLRDESNRNGFSERKTCESTCVLPNVISKV